MSLDSVLLDRFYFGLIGFYSISSIFSFTWFELDFHRTHPNVRVIQVIR